MILASTLGESSAAMVSHGSPPEMCIRDRPSSGEPWETIAAELAPKIDAKIKELYEA